MEKNIAVSECKGLIRQLTFEKDVPLIICNAAIEDVARDSIAAMEQDSYSHTEIGKVEQVLERLVAKARPVGTISLPDDIVSGEDDDYTGLCRSLFFVQIKWEGKVVEAAWSVSKGPEATEVRALIASKEGSYGK
jgi:hypothetical protein